VTTTIPARLRPMTDNERTAADMRADGKSVAEIRDRTGLTGPEIAAAVELRDKFGQILGEAGDAPAPVRVSNGTRPAAAPKPVVKPTPAVPKDDIETLLTAAEQSPQPRARQIAADLRNGIATLRTLIVNDEKFRKLTALVEVHRKHLVEAEAELAALLDLDAVPEAVPIDVPIIDRATGLEVPEPTAADWDLIPAGTPGEGPVPAAGSTPAAPVLKQSAPIQARDRLAYSADVRAWAMHEGWSVSTAGRMSGAVVTAFIKAHPSANKPEAVQP
jgi:hypothetical protein